MPRINKLRLRARCAHCQHELDTTVEFCGCGTSMPMVADVQLTWLDREGPTRNRYIFGRETWKE